MKGTLYLALAMLAVSAGLIGLAAGRGTAGSQIREGGTLRVSMIGIDYVDPALAYDPGSWLLLEATCAKLMNYPDRPLPDGLRAVPEVAAGYPRVSAGGKLYTFRLRSGFRFNNGRRLTARSFADQINRILLLGRTPGQVFGLQYVKDIAGAQDVLDGKASTPSGVVARGNRLVVRLEKPIPDFPARLAMPFFCAVAPGLPVDPEGIGAYASAGPYYVAAYEPGRRVVIKENPFYRGKRPHHVDRFDVDLTPTPGEMVDRIERGEADWGWMGGIALAERGRDLVRKYGVNRARLFIRPSPALRYFVLNTERPLFRGNARLRRAINLAVDRAALTDTRGYLAARATDQYLPIGFPGFRDARIYPLRRPDVRRAKALARGRLRGGKAVLYTANRPLAVSLAQIVQRDLARIGLQVEIREFPLAAIFGKLATRGEPFDIGWTPGFVADYGDPYAFINLLLDGRQIGGPANQNWSYFNSRKYNRLMDRASRLSGAARYQAYAKLDRQLASDAAPMIAYATDNAWTFVSNRVGCKILRPALDLAAVCLKR
jgi:peptide/nickel transport system substrate-binding protein